VCDGELELVRSGRLSFAELRVAEALAWRRCWFLHTSSWWSAEFVRRGLGVGTERAAPSRHGLQLVHHRPVDVDLHCFGWLGRWCLLHDVAT